MIGPPGRMEPGTGEINQPAVAQALSDGAYGGIIGMGAFASGNPESVLEAFDSAVTVCGSDGHP